ncbi:hypothetical protein C8R46DRAFT_280470 [Mycena filopes]|nr:hypothetical protein C8R46DRAFT_280470 [Mycena filopes]
MADLQRGTIFRIISLSLAAGDVFQTIPGTYTLYKKQWTRRRLSPICFFYAMARYMTILSLAANAHAAFSRSPSYEDCRRIYLLPNVTALLAGIAVQVVVYIRAVAISGRAKRVRFGLGLVMLLGFPVQTFGILYHRDPFFDPVTGLCKGKVLHPTEPDWNIVYYSAHMAFDSIACATATYYIVASSYFQGAFRLSKLLRHILRDGLMYFLVVFLVNLWVVLEFAKVLVTGAASMLPLAVVLIAVQHLILSTQRITAGHQVSAHASDTVSQGPPRFYPRTTRDSSQLDVELEAGVFVVSAADTFVHPRNNKNVSSLHSEEPAPTERKHRTSSEGAGPAAAGVPMAL